MSNNVKKADLCLRFFALIAGAICAVICCVAMALEFEAETKLFKSDAVFVTVYEMLCVICSLCAVVFSVFLTKKSAGDIASPEEEDDDFYFKKDRAPVKAVRFTAAALIFVASLVDFIVIFSNTKLQVLPPILEIARLFAAFAIVLYFIPEIADTVEDFFGKVHIYCGLFGLLWFFFTVLREYFKMDVPIASHYRILGHMALIICMVAIMFDLKIKTGAYAVKRRLAFLSIGFIFGFSFGVGQIVMTILGKAPSISSIASAVIVLAMSCYFGIKLAFDRDDSVNNTQLASSEQ